MRQVLLGLLGAMAVSAALGETYSFSAVTTDAHIYQTLVSCAGPKIGERIPSGCILSEPAIAYPNHNHHHQWVNQTPHHSAGVVCASEHPIVFYPNGTLAGCMLEAEQPVAQARGFMFTVPLEGCKGLVLFDRDGRVDC